MEPAEAQMMTGRAAMTVIGGLTGLALWAMLDLLPDILTDPHLFVTVVAAGAGFAAVMLAITGPVHITRAAIGAALLALPAAALLGWGSYRYDSNAALWQDGLLVQAWGAFLFLGTPFAAAWVWDRAAFRNYEVLFDYAWSIVVRYTAAWMFVGVFWVLVFLSDALLEIVGITFISQLLEHAPVPYTLSGAVLGLALMVGYELRDYLSPYLVLHLLRLLVPALLVVVLVFVGALPFQDAANPFGGLSPAGTLLAVLAGAVSLISVAIDKNDEEAVDIRFMRLATEGLALLLPVLAGLIIYSLWLRVEQHGWTPERLAAAVLAMFATAYAVFYALSVLRRGAWMARIRKANVIIALGMMGAAALWMSPLFDAERIATQSQINRYLDGRLPVESVPVWEMVHEWGVAGREGAESLRALEGDDHAKLRETVGFAISTGKRHIFDRKSDDVLREDKVARLAGMISILPRDLEVDPELLSSLPDFRLQDWLAACGRESDPGCVAVIGEFDTALPGDEGVIFLPGSGGRYDAMNVTVQDGVLSVGNYLVDRRNGATARLTREQVGQVLEGAFSIAPSSLNSLWLGEMELLPQN